MNLVNHSKNTLAEATLAIDKDGRSHVVVVVKASLSIPRERNESITYLKPQPLAYTDIHVGKPGLSAPLYECDFVLRKAKCDVLLNAQGYTSDGEPKKRSVVALEIGALKKEIVITGERKWEKGLVSSSISEPGYFTEMPLHYGNAFGGTRHYFEKEQELIDVYQANPLGKGYSSRSNWADAKLNNLPNLTLPGKEIKSMSSEYPPVAFSVLPRNSLIRRKYAGTYDDKWKKEVFPFLPEDFDERYWQSAPEDQQIDFPKGGEVVYFKQLIKGRPELYFSLPRLNIVPIKILAADGQEFTPLVVVDTLYFEPDAWRFSVVWRANFPIKNPLQELENIVVGEENPIKSTN